MWMNITDIVFNDRSQTQKAPSVWLPSSNISKQEEQQMLSEARRRAEMDRGNLCLSLGRNLILEVDAPGLQM